MPQKTKQQAAQKALVNVSEEMARPRVVESAQKTVANPAKSGVARRK
jgi:hypothetical protein